MMENKDNSAIYRITIAALLGLMVGGVVFFFLGRSSEPTVVAPEVVAAPSGESSGGWSGPTETVILESPDATAPLPDGVNPDTGVDVFTSYGYNFNELQDGRPTVVLWEDFQCPGCANYEVSPAKASLIKWANDGEINLVYRPIGFLDFSTRGDSSQRATSAWGCAIDAGVGDKYRSLVFANQPREEGVGFPNEGLLQGGELAGLQGDAYTEFVECVESGKYLAWSQSSTSTTPQEVGGTPTVMIDGAVISPSEMGDVQVLRDAVDAAKK